MSSPQQHVLTIEEAQQARALACLLRDRAHDLSKRTYGDQLSAHDAMYVGRLVEAFEQADDAIFDALNTAATYGSCPNCDDVTDDWRMRKEQRAAARSEADAVRDALRDDPHVSNADYGRLVEEAADADERRSWDGERDTSV